MSTEAKEPGQLAYEAYHGVLRNQRWWHAEGSEDRKAWAAVERACAVPAATQDPIAMYREVISAAAAAVRLACGVDEDNEGEAEQLRKAAIKCRDLGKALLEATQAAEAGKAQAESAWAALARWCATDAKEKRIGMNEYADGRWKVWAEWNDDAVTVGSGASADAASADLVACLNKMGGAYVIPPPPSAPEGT